MDDFDKLNIAQLIVRRASCPDDSREARALDALIVFRNTEARQEKEKEMEKEKAIALAKIQSEKEIEIARINANASKFSETHASDGKQINNN